jgi:hypothetical protein
MKVSVPNTKDQLMSFIVNNLAVKFCDVLHEWLTEDELAIVVERNASRDCECVCHSHDFCDANMAMDEAWSRMFQDEIDLSSEIDTDLWNAAWDLAKKHNFNTNK